MNKYLGFLIKSSFVVVLFYYLWSRELISFQSLQFALREHLPLVLLGQSLLILGSLFTVIRWALLLRSNGVFLKKAELLKLHFIGLFFNVALPGAVSGDFVKALSVGRQAPGSRSVVLGSIFMDRILGVSGMFIISALSLLENYQEYSQSGIITGLRSFILIAGLGIVFFYLYIFFINDSQDLILRVLGSIKNNAGTGKVFKTFTSIENVYLGIKSYRKHPKTLFFSLMISIFVQLLSCIACYLFLRSLDVNSVSISKLVTVTPMGYLVTAIPILPGGVGTGHAAFSFFYQLIGTSKGADVFNLIIASTVILAVIGSFVYLLSGKRYQYS